MASLFSVRLNSILGFLSCLLASGVGFAADPETLTLPPGLSLWDESFNVRVGLGYNDNLLLSEVNQEESPFVTIGLEATLLRLPLDGTQVVVFLSGEDTRYWHGHGLPKDQLVFGQAQVKKQFAGEWNAGLTLQSTYTDTVFDASITETNLTPVPARGYSFRGAPSLRREFLKKYWVELEFGVSRQYFDAPLDDYWEFGPKLTLGKNYGNQSTLALSYQFNQRSYDDRTPLNSDLSPEVGQTLEYSRHGVELALRHNWDEHRRWRTLTSVVGEFNRDNGSGYFDYFSYRLTQQVRYVAKMWEAKVQAKFSYYDYPNQFVGTDTHSKRYLSNLRLNLRGERKLAQKIKLFAEYEYERSFSNETVSEYQVNKVTGGIDWEF